MGLLTGTSWDFSNISRDISAMWAHESTSLDVNKATGMLTSNAKAAKGIFCDSVTCFGTNKCCSNWSHRPKSGSSKLPTSCLHGYSVSLRNMQAILLFLGGDVRNTSDCPGRSDSYVALENET